MQIEHHPPAARGVASLMYVGDDEAVENAVSEPTGLEIGIVALGLTTALLTRGTLRTAGAAAAAVVALRHLARGAAR